MWDWLNDPIAAVVAALIAATASIATTFFVVREKKSSARQQQRHDLAMRAMSFFDKKTQRRNVGISSLEPLWDDADFKDYVESWQNLYYGSVIYVLYEGSNRKKTHELVNVTRMIERLIRSKFFIYPHRRDNIVQALYAYKREIEEAEFHEDSYRASFVKDFTPRWIERIEKQFQSRGVSN